MGNDPEREKLDDLAARIEQASAKPVREEAVTKNEVTAMGRIGFDFMAAILGSALLGWLVDKQFGTKPWGMMVLIFLGFIAGIMNVWRALSKNK